MSKVREESGREFVYDVRRDPTNTETWEGGCTCGFRSSGWPTKKMATERIEGHAAEHASGVPAEELVDFKSAVGWDQDYAPAPPTDPFQE